MPGDHGGEVGGGEVVLGEARKEGSEKGRNPADKDGSSQAASFRSFFPCRQQTPRTGINCIQLAKQQTHERAKEIIARIKNFDRCESIQPNG